MWTLHLRLQPIFSKTSLTMLMMMINCIMAQPDNSDEILDIQQLGDSQILLSHREGQGTVPEGKFRKLG